MGVVVKDSASNLVKWGIVAVVLIIGLMFMFPWLVNLGVSNMTIAWGDQVQAFIDSITQTTTDVQTGAQDYLTGIGEGWDSGLANMSSQVTGVTDSIGNWWASLWEGLSFP